MREMLLGMFLFAAASLSRPDVDLIAGGDVMLARGIDFRITHGKTDPFQKISPLLQNADVAFCNLEAMISSEAQTAGLKLAATPEKAALLKAAGFNVISLANNHAMDFGFKAIRETKNLLKQNNIAAFGAGANISEARTPA